MRRLWYKKKKSIEPGHQQIKTLIGGQSDTWLPLISQRLHTPSGEQDAESPWNHSLKKKQEGERRKMGGGWWDSQGHLNKHKPDADHAEHVWTWNRSVWISAFSNMFTAHGADMSDDVGRECCAWVLLFFYLWERPIWLSGTGGEDVLFGPVSGLGVGFTVTGRVTLRIRLGWLELFSCLWSLSRSPFILQKSLEKLFQEMLLSLSFSRALLIKRKMWKKTFYFIKAINKSILNSWN